MFTYLGSRGDAITQQERDYLAFLHRTPAEDISQDATRITLVAPMLLIAYGCLMPFLLLHFYVEPYQIGAGVIAVGESIDWSGLEPWFVLGPLVIHVPLGVVAWRVIRKRYTPEAT